MADILIRGMEMPTSCGLCPMFCDDINDYCSAAQRSIPFDAEKPEWCPLVPLPEGHGRLVDADAIMASLGDVPYKGSVRRVLMSAPTIVPAEGGKDNG